MRGRFFLWLLLFITTWTLVAQEAAETPTLAVTEIFPANGSVTAIDAQVVVVFNRPVVPLVTSRDQATLPQPLVFTPAVEGVGEWLNTAIYTFKPSIGFAGGTRYEVRIPADSLQSVDGFKLVQDFVATFNTETPRISHRYPRPADRSVRLDETVQVSFSQPMDRANTERAFTLRVDRDGAPPVRGTFTWNEDSTGFTFKPDALLEIASAYNVSFSDEARAAGGGASLHGEMRTWRFFTVPYPTITGTEPFDGQTDVPTYRGFTLSFASPMDVDSVKARVRISPTPEQEPEVYYYDWSNAITWWFVAYPDTEYTVTVESGMKDIYGNVLEESLVVRYRTASYSSDLSLRAPGSIGFYNAERVPVGLYLSHLNVSHVDLALWQVEKMRFVQELLKGSAYDFRPQPNTDTLLNEWRIPSVAPRNAMRFEFIDLKQQLGGAGDTGCAGVPPSRLKEGDVAVVKAEPNLRARATPQTGQILTLLYPNTQVQVLEPRCVEGVLWWRIRLRDGSPAWVAEAVGEEYLLEPLVAAQVTPVTLPDGMDKLPLGIYHLTAQAPELRQDWYTQRHFMVVANAQLTLKSSPNEVLVWATHVQTGQPIANAPVRLFLDNDRSFTVTTDADGLARIAVPRIRSPYDGQVALLDDGTHFGIGYNDWSVELYSFAISANYLPPRYQVYVYTDRPVYRPDQPVYYRGVVRLKDDMRYSIPRDLRTVPVTVYNYANDIVFEDEVALTPNGTFSGTFTLAPDTTLGYHYLEVRLPSEDGADYWQTEGGSVSFNVAQYRLPQFQVSVTPAVSQVVQGDTIDVMVNSRYFFGGAVSNAEVTYSVVASPYDFAYAGRDFFSFGDYNYDEGPAFFYDGSSTRIADGVARSDAQGMVMLTLPATASERGGSQTYLIEASVRDETDQVVSGRAEVVVHQGLLYVGVRPLRYVYNANSAATAEIVTVDWDSQPIANQDVTVRVVERRWSSVQERSPDGRTNWTWEVEEIPLGDAQTLTSDANGLARFEFTPPRGGTYKIYATTRDTRGNTVTSSTLLWVSGRNYVAWRQQNSNRIDLIADKSDYAIGDVAEILIASPFQGAVEALVTVERGGVLKAERITLESNSAVYRLPIEENFAPNVFVSVMLVKGVDENNRVMAHRVGYVQLGVENTRYALTLAVESDTERAEPQQTVTYTVTVTDYTGAPVRAEVGVAVTDLASLSLGEPNSLDILQHFYNRQSLSVRTSTPYVVNADVYTQEILDTFKGGGGGFSEDGIIAVRGEFIDTPYWNATLQTDANGQATFSVRLPDNLTTWRLDARAVANVTPDKLLVGQTTQDLQSTKPLLIRPVTPRFFVVGDEVVLGAVVNNNTDEAQDATVTLAISGVELLDDAAQRVTIAAGGRARVNWRVRVQSVAAVVASFSVRSGSYSDATISPVSKDAQGTLPVYRYDVPEYVGTAGVLRENDTRSEQVLIPSDVVGGELRVKLDYSLASAMLDTLEALESQDYDFIEWTVSRFLPNIASYQALEAGGFANPTLRAALEREVNLALQKLAAEQKGDGGWGWSLRDDSNEYVTAYALMGLAAAREAGFTVSNTLIGRAQTFLQTKLIATSTSTPVWQLNRQAFMLYALAYSGKHDIGRAAALFDQYLRMELWAVGLLAQTLHRINPSETTRTDTLVNHLLNQAITSATGIHWQERGHDSRSWNTDTRTTAIALQTLVMLRPDSTLLPQVVRYLMVQRRAEIWETSQETAWAVMALSAWMTASGELDPAYAYTLTLNDGAPLSGNVTRDNVLGDGATLVVAVADLLKAQANTLRITRTGERGALYYTAHLRADLPVTSVEALNKGILLDRRYIDPVSGDPVSEGRVGDLIETRVTIIVPSTRHYIVIEDPLPAGGEGVDPNLLTSAQIGTRPSFGDDDPLSYGWGWWWFSQIQFRDDKVTLSATYLPAGTYEFRYTMRLSVPGVYQVIPTTAREFYFPEVYGRTAGSLFTVLPNE